jgi:hypothetical protein
MEPRLNRKQIEAFRFRLGPILSFLDNIHDRLLSILADAEHQQLSGRNRTSSLVVR